MSFPANTNLCRWVMASCLLHFRNIFPYSANANGGYPYKQGQFQDAGASTAQQALERLELRVDGPWTQRRHKTSVNIFEVNILVITTRGSNDIFRHEERVDAVRNKFVDCIPVYQIEKTSIEPFTQVGSLHVEATERRPMFVKHFGQIDPKFPVLQSTTEARYWYHQNEV